MTQDSENSSKIVRRGDLVRLREADTILREAMTARRESEAAVAAHEKQILADAHQRALRDAAKTASRVIAEAEAATNARLLDLEPEIARLVARTVRAILGTYEPEEATYRAAVNALSLMRDHRQGRIFAAEDTAAALRRAVADLGPNGAEITEVFIDPALDRGRAHLVSDRGSAEIGLAALTDKALRAWDGGGDNRGDGRGDGAAATPAKPEDSK